MTGLGGSQFRESAIIRNAQPESLDDLAQLTSPREWTVLACLGLTLAAIAVWSVFGSVERTLRSDGVLVLSGERRTVMSGVTGTVAEVSASEGQRVAAGQAIMRVSLVELERPARFAAASVRLLEEEAKNSTGTAHAETRRLLASARALLDRLAALREDGEIVSPGDGVIGATLVAPGEAIVTGTPVAELVSGDGSRLDAAAFVERRSFRRLTSGMTARVIVETPEGDRSYAAELTEIAPRAADPPGWLARMLPTAGSGSRGYVIRLKVPEAQERGLPSGRSSMQGLEDGMPCRIEIVLERTSPLGLLIRS